MEYRLKRCSDVNTRDIRSILKYCLDKCKKIYEGYESYNFKNTKEALKDSEEALENFDKEVFIENMRGIIEFEENVLFQKQILLTELYDELNTYKSWFGVSDLLRKNGVEYRFMIPEKIEEVQDSIQELYEEHGDRMVDLFPIFYSYNNIIHIMDFKISKDERWIRYFDFDNYIIHYLFKVENNVETLAKFKLKFELFQEFLQVFKRVRFIDSTRFSREKKAVRRILKRLQLKEIEEMTEKLNILVKMLPKDIVYYCILPYINETLVK